MGKNYKNDEKNKNKRIAPCHLSNNNLVTGTFEVANAFASH